MLLVCLASLLSLALSSPPPMVGSLWNLEEVTVCELHYNALVYNNYGCWCGIGGSHEPVDGIDECCMHHDKCYDAAVDNKICFDTAWEYVDNYEWKCSNGTANCTADQDDCKTALCACDKAVVDCWSKYPKPEKKAKCNRTKWMVKTQHFHH